MVSSVPRELVKDHQEGESLLPHARLSHVCLALFLAHFCPTAVLGLELVRIQGCFSMSQLKQALGWPEARCRDAVNFFLKEVGHSLNPPARIPSFTQQPLTGYSLARRQKVRAPRSSVLFLAVMLSYAHSLQNSTSPSEQMYWFPSIFFSFSQRVGS